MRPMRMIGWHHAEVILLLAAVLGLTDADQCTVGAIITFEKLLSIGNPSRPTGFGFDRRGALAALVIGGWSIGSASVC